MADAIATGLVSAAGLYLALGLAFAIGFSARGAAKIDPGAREATRGFRLLIVPGAAALWPLLLHRWLRGEPEPPTERNAHRSAAR